MIITIDLKGKFHALVSNFTFWVEQVEFDRFKTDHQCRAEDRLLRCRVRDLGCGARETHDDLAVVLRTGTVLKDFKSNMGSIQIRKNQNIGRMAHFCVRQLHFRSTRVKCDISL